MRICAAGVDDAIADGSTKGSSREALSNCFTKEPLGKDSCSLCAIATFEDWCGGPAMVEGVLVVWARERFELVAIPGVSVLLCATVGGRILKWLEF